MSQQLSAVLQAASRKTPLIMGILNVTPDSFSDGGRLTQPTRFCETALAMQSAGAQLLDVGGESTRPGAEPVSELEELDRVMPAIEWLKTETDVWVSVDTTKPAVMIEALKQGVDLVNDVHALQAPGALDAVKASDCSVCLMHHPGSLKQMHTTEVYDPDVVTVVSNFLQQRAAVCEQAGIDQHRLILDPGFGFGKTQEQNVALFQSIDQLAQLPYPILVGVSRKRMIGALSGVAVADQRQAGSVAAAVVAMQQGASVIRVHDVAMTSQALKVAQALMPMTDSPTLGS